MSSALISVNDLSVSYWSFGTYQKAISDVSLEIYEGETLGIVGESGSGKSTLGWSMLGLIERPNLITGSITYRGVGDVLKLSESELANYRWKKIAMIFQSSMNSFDPLQTIGKSFVQLLIEKHLASDKQNAREIIESSFMELNLPPSIFYRFPHELSGGMKQRVIIAMATAASPEVLIADEPTTALDTVSQFNVINILKDLIKSSKVKNMVFITHDISVQLILADRIVVMLGGRIVETGNKSEILSNPKHPYTRILFKSFLKKEEQTNGIDHRHIIDNSKEAGLNGCPFASKCNYADQRCFSSFPKGQDISPTHRVYCYLYGD